MNLFVAKFISRQDFYHLRIHLQIHDNDVSKCSFCPWTGVFRHYFHHISNHFRYKPFQCEACPEKFYTKHTVLRHFESAHEKHLENYSCEICEFKTNSRQNLYKHNNKHMK